MNDYLGADTVGNEGVLTEYYFGIGFRLWFKRATKL